MVILLKRKMKLKRLFRNWKIIILIAFLVIALIVIEPNPWAEGVKVIRVESNSSLGEQGLSVGEIILSINNQEINNLDDYSKAVLNLKENESYRMTVLTDRNEYIYLAEGKPKIEVKEVESSNIIRGLELAGGTRVLLKPDIKDVSDKEINNLIAILKTRLDVYGLSDLTIRSAKDLSGNKFVLVEIGGATQKEVRELIAKQGKFEAKIGNETVFVGEKKDIRRVCKDDGTCSGIRDCGQVQGGYSCTFEFAVTLSPEAAKRHAEVTKDLGLNVSMGGRYLEKPLDLFLDDTLVDSLLISADLKGKETTDISISGPGIGNTQEQAIEDALMNMNKLQTVLIVGSLPFKIDIVKMDSTSPVLGGEFVKNIFIAVLVAVLAVSLVIGIRYRRLKIIIPTLITMLSEIFLILGFAAFIRWRLDMAAIAGILAAVGTGVDDQIIIADEVLKGKEEVYDWKERMKKAFFIILAAYAATVAAMLPLWNAGAGLVRGFALTTIVGVTIGVLITRPAFAAIIENLLKE